MEAESYREPGKCGTCGEDIGHVCAEPKRPMPIFWQLAVGVLCAVGLFTIGQAIDAKIARALTGTPLTMTMLRDPLTGDVTESNFALSSDPGQIWLNAPGGLRIQADKPGEPGDVLTLTDAGTWVPMKPRR